MEVHAAAAANDGGARLFVHAVKVDKSDRRRMLGFDGPLRRTDFEGRPRPIRLGEMGVAVETLLAHVLAGLDADQPDVEPRVPVRREGQRPGDADGADGLVEAAVVDDDVPGADQDAGAGRGELAALPGVGVRPRAAVGGADHRRQVGGGRAGGGDDQGEEDRGDENASPCPA